LKILLDENFPLPLPLHRRLREKGYDAEHVIVLGQRGMPDAALREQLAKEALVSNDTEFEQLAGDIPAQVSISRLPQRLPTAQRVEIWLKALDAFLQRKPQGSLFDLMPDGEIVAWEIRPLRKGS